MPSTDAFDRQDAAYRESVLPSDVTARVAIEVGIADFWYKYVGFDGRIIGMTTFGESAPAGELFKMFGFTIENAVEIQQRITRLILFALNKASRCGLYARGASRYFRLSQRYDRYSSLKKRFASCE